ncbi:hypothetical protein ACFPRL_29625 [Pseudoclavibacter helvolus]
MPPSAGSSTGPRVARCGAANCTATPSRIPARPANMSSMAEG